MIRLFGSIKNAIESSGIDYGNLTILKKDLKYNPTLFYKKSNKLLPDIPDDYAEESKCIGFIYVTINLINGKKYVGQSVMKKKWKTYLGSGYRIQRAIKKYGIKNFKRQIIELCNSKDDLKKSERKWIAYFDASSNKNEEFYNVSDGGDGDNFTGQTEEKKQEIRNIISSKAKERLKIKENCSMYGVRGINNSLSKQVYQICPKTGHVLNQFESTLDVYEKTNYQSSWISTVCREVNTTELWHLAYGFYWCYKEDIEKFQLNNINTFTNICNKEVCRIIPETGVIDKCFKSIREAAKFHKVSPSSISYACNSQDGGSISCGYRWIFKNKEDYKKRGKWNGEIKRGRLKNINKNKSKNNGRKLKKVVQLNSENLSLIKEWKSVKEAADSLNTRADNIYCCLTGQSATSIGFIWMYSEMYYNLDESELTAIKQSVTKNIKKGKRNNEIEVVQLTKEFDYINEFSSIASASRSLNIKSTCICNVCKGTQKTAGGFVFKYKNDYQSE